MIGYSTLRYSYLSTIAYSLSMGTSDSRFYLGVPEAWLPSLLGNFRGADGPVTVPTDAVALELSEL